MKKQITAEQKAQRDERAARVKELARTVAKMSPEERAAILDRVGAIVTIEGHALSPRNTCLTVMQIHTASVVGGFQQWRRAGRMVRKGQHGAAIAVPARRKSNTHTETPAAEASAEEPNDLFFTYTTVFDVSQTDPIEGTDTDTDGETATASETTTPSAAAAAPAPEPQQAAFEF